MRLFDPFIMGVLMVIFRSKVSKPFVVLCYLYSNVEGISVYLYHVVCFTKFIIWVLRKRERERALFVIPS